MSLFHLSGGILVESDVVSLSPSLCVNNNSLSDAATGSLHGLHPKAVMAIAQLQKPIVAGDWVKVIKKSDISDRQITELIWFINSIGGWKIKRGLTGTAKNWYKRAGMQLVGLKTQTIARRERATFRNITTVVIRSCLPIVCLSLILSVLLYGANFPLKSLAGLMFSFFLLLIISTVAHEYTHLLTTHRRKSAAVLQRGLRLGILHEPQSRQREFASAILGPIAGILSALLVGVLISTARQEANILKLSWLVSAFHLASWMPIYGDGQAIKTILKNNEITHEKAAA